MGLTEVIERPSRTKREKRSKTPFEFLTKGSNGLSEVHVLDLKAVLAEAGRFEEIEEAKHRLKLFDGSSSRDVLVDTFNRFYRIPAIRRRVNAEFDQIGISRRRITSYLSREYPDSGLKQRDGEFDPRNKIDACIDSVMFYTIKGFLCPMGADAVGWR